MHGEVELTRFNRGFDVEFDSSSEIGIEIENKPRREHSYDPDTNRLSCPEASERDFPIKIDVYPKGSVRSSGRYHTLSIKDTDTGHSLIEFEVIDVRG